MFAEQAGRSQLSSNFCLLPDVVNMYIKAYLQLLLDVLDYVANQSSEKKSQ